jgi:hypothetical protein
VNLCADVKDNKKLKPSESEVRKIEPLFTVSPPRLLEENASLIQEVITYTCLDMLAKSLQKAKILSIP